jgi:hypothetical protein
MNGEIKVMFVAILAAAMYVFLPVLVFCATLWYRYTTFF